ncbi:MAG: transcriptional repressor [archaeon]
MARQTKQKKIIMDALSKIDTFFSAEKLFNSVKKKDKGIGIATIYRFLNEMKKKGELYSFTCDRRAVYSRKGKSHCHFTCENTGKVTHFEIDSLDFLKDKIPGTIKSFQIEVQGVCEECRGNKY